MGAFWESRAGGEAACGKTVFGPPRHRPDAPPAAPVWCFCAQSCCTKAQCGPALPARMRCRDTQ
eukprot:11212472-Alexandrium_andersonii.AAC.1